jgi:hypothetical protein
MAITSGINGTFSPTVHDYEPIEYAKIRKITKKVFINGVWEDKLFILLTDNTSLSKRQEIQDWLKEHYGNPAYQQTWWATFSSVCMSDKIYTHWKLLQ